MPENETKLPGTEIAKAIAIAALVAVAGIGPWMVMAPLNAEIRPDLPWAAAGAALGLVLVLAWLGGFGPPRGSRETRRRLLRLWPPSPEAGPARGPSAWVCIGLLAILYLLWIAAGRMQGPPDLSPYPTTAYRFSLLIMGAVVSGVAEEAAFRGYLQRRLEPWGASRAIMITSIVFVLFHGVHGPATLLLLGPGLFAASWLYGWLAVRTGTIVPGMILHALGDLAYTWFGTLGGDWRLLFVG